MPETHAFLIAGETSGDQLAAELVHQWRLRRPGLLCSGAGGSAMAAAGVDLAFDLTAHSVIGLWEVLRRYRTFRRLFHQLLDRCLTLRPDIVVGVDYGGFNLRFAKALRERSRGTGWTPRIVQYVSPQVWASRPGRARRMEQSHDLLLSILPFETQWYARNAPGLPVRFVGHPIVDRHAGHAVEPRPCVGRQLLLLPGSRVGELQRHLPILLETARRLRANPPTSDVRTRLVLPQARLMELANSLGASRDGAPVPEIGGLPEALRESTLALASTGTVTLECAWFGVPTLALYRTSWLTYQIGRRVITVKHLAMPNLLADGVVMPEFIQADANPERLAAAATAWLGDPAALQATRNRLRSLVTTLGEPGAARRAAGHLEELLESGATPNRLGTANR